MISTCVAYFFQEFRHIPASLICQVLYVLKIKHQFYSKHELYQLIQHALNIVYKILYLQVLYILCKSPLFLIYPSCEWLLPMIHGLAVTKSSQEQMLHQPDRIYGESVTYPPGGVLHILRVYFCIYGVGFLSLPIII